jgi:hypothetical protein
VFLRGSLCGSHKGRHIRVLAIPIINFNSVFSGIAEGLLWVADSCNLHAVSGSMRRMWKRSDGSAIEAPPDERGGNR